VICWGLHIAKQTTGFCGKERGKKALMQKHCDLCGVFDLLSHPKLMKKDVYRKKRDYSSN